MNFKNVLRRSQTNHLRSSIQHHQRFAFFVINSKKAPAHRFCRKLPEARNSTTIPTTIVRVLSVTERQLQQHKIAKILYFRDISAKSEIDQMKSLFLSTAAHELRTPMASVFGFFELLLSREFDAQTTREILILTTIHQQSESLVAMLNELLLPGDPRQVQLMKPTTDFRQLSMRKNSGR
jgi:signal transduction histidine kinase